MSFSYWGADPYAPVQYLTLSGDYIGLFPGGNAVNVGSTTTVALTADKTTAITFNGGLLETNVAGNLNIDSGSILGSQRLTGSKLEITPPPDGGYVVSVDGLDALQISSGTVQLISTVVSSLQILSEVYDFTGNQGTAGQILTSGGAGLPVYWGAGGGGGGITGVLGGTNISVDNTIPTAPTVNLSSSVSVPNLIASGTNDGMKVKMETDQVNGFGYVHFLAANAVKASVNYTSVNNTVAMVGGNNGTVVLGSYSGFGPNSLLQVKPDGVIETTGTNFLVNSDISIKGSDASLNFFDTSNVQKASVNYAEINDKLTTTCSNLVFDTGSQQLIMASGQTILQSEAGGIDIKTDADIHISSGNGVIVDCSNGAATINGCDSVMARDSTGR